MVAFLWNGSQDTDFVVVFGVLRPFDTCHFGCGQLTYPHCSWASFIGSLPVLPFLNQRKGENGRRNDFMTKLHERMLPDVRIEPATVRIPGGRASDRAIAPGTGIQKIPNPLKNSKWNILGLREHTYFWWSSSSADIPLLTYHGSVGVGNRWNQWKYHWYNAATCSWPWLQSLLVQLRLPLSEDWLLPW